MQAAEQNATAGGAAGQAADGGRPVVLLIAGFFPPDPASGAARVGRFARYLGRFGYDTVAIAQPLPPSVAEDDEPNVVRVPSATPGRRARILAGVHRRVQRYLLPYDDRRPWGAHAWEAAREIVASRRVDVVLSSSPPLATHLVARRVKRRLGIPWVADFRDPLLGNPFRTRRWFFPHDAMVESAIFREADAVVANTDTVASMWRGRHGALADKATVIWNGFDPGDRAAPAPVAGGRRVLAHVGSLYGGRHPGRPISSVSRLVRRGELDPAGVLLHFIGPTGGAWLEAYREPIEHLEGLGCLEIPGMQVPKDEARRAAAEADYLLLLDVNDRDADLQVPAKIFEYAQIGRPVLAYTRRDSPSERILRGAGVPHRSVHGDIPDDEADRLVLEFLGLPSVPVAPSDWFEDRFNGLNQVASLAEILDRARGVATRAGVAPEGRAG